MTIDHATTTAAAPPAGSPGADSKTAGDHAPPPRRRRRRRGVVVAVAAVAGLALATVVAARDGGGEGDGTAADTTTAAAEVRDLVLTDDYEGDLGFGATAAVKARRSGVVTGVAAVGTVVRQGEALFDVDLQPTVLVHGDIPAFRDLSVASDPGADITQLEQALVALGFGADITVDDTFTAATARAVTAWEDLLGRADPDGVVTLGDVVFAPADVRVAALSAERGTQLQSGAEVVEVTATAKVVTLELSVDEVADVEAGAPVTIELPDGTEARGTIANVATEPTTDAGAGSGSDGGGEDEATYAVTVTIDDPRRADAFDSGAVEVIVERSRTEDATAVPVIALLALREGGYALQVVDHRRPEGSTLVPVGVGVVADDWVQVSGDGIEAGVKVVVPA